MFTKGFNVFLTGSLGLAAAFLGLHFFGGKEDSFLLLHRWRNPFFDAAMPWLTFLGDAFVYLLLLPAFFASARPRFIHYAGSGLLVLLLVQVCKYLVWPMATRPIAVLPGESLFILPNETTHSLHSFPSGHTATAFLICGMLAFYSKKGYVGCWLLLPGLVVGYSRIYLAQHWPADIAAGIISGITGVLVVWWLLPKHFRQA